MKVFIPLHLVIGIIALVSALPAPGDHVRKENHNCIYLDSHKEEQINYVVERLTEFLNDLADEMGDLDLTVLNLEIDQHFDDEEEEKDTVLQLTVNNCVRYTHEHDADYGQRQQQSPQTEADLDSNGYQNTTTVDGANTTLDDENVTSESPEETLNQNNTNVGSEKVETTTNSNDNNNSTIVSKDESSENPDKEVTTEISEIISSQNSTTENTDCVVTTEISPQENEAEQSQHLLDDDKNSNNFQNIDDANNTSEVPDKTLSQDDSNDDKKENDTTVTSEVPNKALIQSDTDKDEIGNTSSEAPENATVVNDEINGDINGNNPTKSDENVSNTTTEVIDTTSIQNGVYEDQINTTTLENQDISTISNQKEYQIGDKNINNPNNSNEIYSTTEIPEVTSNQNDIESTIGNDSQNESITDSTSETDTETTTLETITEKENQIDNKNIKNPNNSNEIYSTTETSEVTANQNNIESTNSTSETDTETTTLETINDTINNDNNENQPNDDTNDEKPDDTDSDAINKKPNNYTDSDVINESSTSNLLNVENTQDSKDTPLYENSTNKNNPDVSETKETNANNEGSKNDNDVENEPIQTETGSLSDYQVEEPEDRTERSVGQDVEQSNADTTSDTVTPEVFVINLSEKAESLRNALNKTGQPFIVYRRDLDKSEAFSSINDSSNQNNENDINDNPVVLKLQVIHDTQATPFVVFVEDLIDTNERRYIFF